MTHSFHVAYLHVIHQGVTRLCTVLRLNEEQFEAQELVDGALIIPGGHHRLQIQVRGEKAHDSIGNGSRGFYEQMAVVTDDGRFLTCLVAG